MSDSIQLMDFSQRERVFIDIWDWIKVIVWKAFTFWIFLSSIIYRWRICKKSSTLLISSHFEEVFYLGNKFVLINSVDCWCLDQFYMFSNETNFKYTRFLIHFQSKSSLDEAINCNFHFTRIQRPPSAAFY